MTKGSQAAMIRILHLEDSPLDAELAKALLEASTLKPTIHRVATREAFRDALEGCAYDLILADYHVPGFDGLEAMRMVCEACPDLPFVFLSGRMGEEAAIDSLKHGATDYVLKGRIERLVPAIRRALDEARDRADARAAERRLRESEARLREADRRKDEFLAMLSHELRNPLAVIATEADTIDCDSPDSVTASVKMIRRQVRHLTRLIDDLLDVARFAQNKVDLKLETLSVVGLVSSAVASVRGLVEARGHTLTVDAEAGEWIAGDPIRMEQVLVNLLINAAKYTPAGGQISLDARRDGDKVAFTVRDNGRGIPPTSLPAMFDLFVQGDRTSARSEGGLGIGLTLVKRLALAHGGDVSASSDGVGMGSQFAVRVPRVAPPAMSESHGAGATATPARSLRILAVDDNTELLDGIKRLLQLDGHQIEIAADGPTALSAAGDGAFDLILVDIGLPGMDGYEVVKRLRELESCRVIPIAAVSGYGQAEDRLKSRNAGFDDHLVKPVEPDRLRQFVREFVISPRPR